MSNSYITTKRQKVSDTTAIELQDYLKSFVAIEFPDSGIDYWGTHWNVSPCEQNAKLPEYGVNSDNFDHVAAYSRQGRTEGRLIELRLVLNDGSTEHVVRAKSFGNEKECWDIARAMSNVVENFYATDELPLAVDYVAKLPLAPETIKQDAEHFSHNRHAVHMQIGQDHVAVFFDDKHLVDRIAIPFSFDEPEKMRFARHVSADWQRICERLHMDFSVLRVGEAPVDEEEPSFSPS